MLPSYYKGGKKKLEKSKLKSILSVTDREAGAFGSVVDVAVAVNYAKHLRGNIYIEFDVPGGAAAAALGLHGRPLRDYEAIVYARLTPIADLAAGQCKDYKTGHPNSCKKRTKCCLLHLERKEMSSRRTKTKKQVEIKSETESSEEEEESQDEEEEAEGEDSEEENN